MLLLSRACIQRQAATAGQLIDAKSLLCCDPLAWGLSYARAAILPSTAAQFTVPAGNLGASTVVLI